MSEHKTPDDTLRWVRRGSALAVLAVGWLFILLQNHFHITAPVVFVGLGYLAAVAAIYTLFRTGSTAVGPVVDDAASWGKPLGMLGELEREKRALIKAIKEAEFDLQMGKLSQSDADSMIAVYRSRAIEVIKEIDILNTATGSTGSTRDRILREARARVEIERQSKDAVKTVDDKKKRDKQKPRADKTSKKSPTAEGEVEVKDEPAAANAIDADEAKPEATDDDAEADPTTDAATAAAATEAESAKEAAP